MDKNIVIKIWRLTVSSLIILALAQCTRMDEHYAEYLENAERIYPGRVDSITFRSGNQRAIIRSRLSTDSRVTKMRVTWGQNSSFETAISPEDIATYRDVVIPEITEGVYTFDIRTYDNEGHESMRSEIFGRVYGPSYVANLNNRIINTTTQNEITGMLNVNWLPEAVDTTLLGTEVRYMKVTGDSAKVFSPGDVLSTQLPMGNAEVKTHYRTLYKPSSLAIDTFYASWVEFTPKDYLVIDRVLYDRTDWTIAGFSSENNNDNHGSKNLIDDKPETFWIARFNSPGTNYPNHWITIDMKEIREADGFMFAQKNGDRKIRELEVQVSDDNVNWESVGLFGLTNVDRVYQYVNLPERRSFRYFKIIPRAGHDNQQAPGLAEAGTFVYGG